MHMLHQHKYANGNGWKKRKQFICLFLECKEHQQLDGGVAWIEQVFLYEYIGAPVKNTAERILQWYQSLRRIQWYKCDGDDPAQAEQYKTAKEQQKKVRILYTPYPEQDGHRPDDEEGGNGYIGSG